MDTTAAFFMQGWQINTEYIFVLCEPTLQHGKKKDKWSW